MFVPHGTVQTAHQIAWSVPPASFLRLQQMLAQARYLPGNGVTLTERVRGFATFGPSVIPLPHPSWRSVGWQRRNPWFESDLLPALRASVQSRL